MRANHARDRNPTIELYAFAVVALGLILYGYPWVLRTSCSAPRPNFSAMPSSRATWRRWGCWSARIPSVRSSGACSRSCRCEAAAADRLGRAGVSSAARESVFFRLHRHVRDAGAFVNGCVGSTRTGDVVWILEIGVRGRADVELQRRRCTGGAHVSAKRGYYYP